MRYFQTPMEYTMSVKARFYTLVSALLGHFEGLTFKEWLDR